MKNSNRKSSLSSGILLVLVGGIFTAIGVALFVIVIKGIVEYGISAIGAGIFMPIIFILAFLGFGITALTMGGKGIYLRVRQSITHVRGKEIIAQIVDCKTASFSKGHNIRIRYALVLAFNEDGEDKIFTTDYLYDVNEFRYLKELDGIKVKVDNNFVTVCEPFPKDIYKVDSTYGIEMAFFRQKPVKILLRLWIILFFAAIIFLIASFFIKNSAITLMAIIILFSIHFPFVIPLAIFLIKWFKR
ncbi:MAG: hypothetical protein K2G37_06575 [Clostridia bacterium]|nr:hypothetical protein [Clostridia bacterium]MDE7329189.1 hypothetical protein [Clostridia bacterium]